jgi:hypothetical protein
MLVAIVEDGAGLAGLLGMLTRHVEEEREALQSAIENDVWPRPKLHLKPPFPYVLCHTIALPSFLVCDVSVSVSVSRSITACLHSLTSHGTSLTIIPASLNQSLSIDTILTSLITIQVLLPRQPGGQCCHGMALPVQADGAAVRDMQALFWLVAAHLLAAEHRVRPSLSPFFPFTCLSLFLSYHYRMT